MIDVKTIPIGCFCLYLPPDEAGGGRLVCLRLTKPFDADRGLVSAFDAEMIKNFRGFGDTPFHRHSDHARLFPARHIYAADEEDVKASGIGYFCLEREEPPRPGESEGAD